MPEFEDYTYPGNQEVPDGPGAFLALIKDIHTKLAAFAGRHEAATYAWASQEEQNATATVDLLAGDLGIRTDTGSILRWTGVAWTEVVGDTGDVLALPSTGWNRDAVFFRRKNGHVTNFGTFTPTANGNLTGAFVQIGMLPPGMYPTQNLLVAGTTSLSQLAQFEITTTGFIRVRTLAGTIAYTTNTQFSLAGLAWQAAV